MKFDGSEIIDTFSSLLNPGVRIPPHITRITGITDEMVADAPHFYEIAREVVEWTEGAIFVAHNVNFDYRFIRHEFKTLGYTFSKKKLCTVQMSRKAFPGLKSYSLGNLIKEFHLEIDARHRALDDALATTELLRKIIQEKNATQEMQVFINEGVSTSKLPNNLTLEYLHDLPECCGVYYFEDEKGNVVYVGKAKNVKKRVFQHFSKCTRKMTRLQENVSAISVTETGSELYALLLEDREIKRLRPPINKAQKASKIRASINYEENEYHSLFVSGKNGADNPLNFFTSTKTAKAYLYNICEEYNLCACHSGLNSENPNNCIEHFTGKCTSGPFHSENPEDYNARVAEAVEHIRAIFKDDFLLMDHGKTVHEKVVFSIKDGYCDRIGVIENEDSYASAEEIYEVLDPFAGMISSNRIILQYLHKYKLQRFDY